MANDYWPSGAPKWLGNKNDYASGNGLIPQPVQKNTNPLIPMPEYQPYKYESYKSKPKLELSSGDETIIPTLAAKAAWDQNQQLQAGISNQNWQNQWGQYGDLAQLDYQNRALGEQQRQFNFGNALDWSKYMGSPIEPVKTGTDLFAQIQGRTPWERTAQEAALTGLYNGQPTWEKQSQEAALTGYLNGQPTLDNYYKSTSLDQGQQQINNDQTYRQQQVNLEQQKLTQDAANSGNDLTQTEKGRVATTSLLDNARKRYSELAGKKQYPLYYTINSLLRDPEVVNAAIQSGADVKTVIDSLIMESANMSPEEYFNTPQGSQLKKYYESVTGKKLDEY